MKMFIPLALTVGAALSQAMAHSYRSAKYLSRCACMHEKKMRDHLSEKQIDHMVEDSFPASDPPSTY